jgi:hypothetical protein
MAGDRLARGGLRETMTEYAKRRLHEVANFGVGAEAAAHEAYGKAIRAKENLILPTQRDVMRFGADLLAGRKPGASVRPSSTAPSSATRPAVAKPPAPQPAPRTVGSSGDSWLDHSPMAKAVAGNVARKAGFIPGAARGAWRIAGDLADDAYFLTRLLNPLDSVITPRGEAAWDKVIDNAGGYVDYARTAISNPSVVLNDINAGAGRMNARLNPDATPPMKTFTGEVRRNFDIGLNRGEVAADVGALVYGGPMLRRMGEFGPGRKILTASDYIAQGVPPGTARYFERPYKGIGHHAVGRSAKLYSWLGGGPVPRTIVESPLTRVGPRGLTNGEFFPLHYGVDKYYYGGKVPADLGGGGWSGKELGWDKYGAVDRYWYGTPGPLKAAAGAGVVGAGAVVDSLWGNEGRE